VNLRLASSILVCACLTACTEPPRAAVIPFRPPGSASHLTLTPEEAGKIEITEASVERQDLPVEIAVAGQVEANADRTTPVLSLVGGRLENVLVKLGDTVKAGQVLVSLKSDDVAQIESDLLTKVLDIEADIVQEKVELKLDRALFERKRLLFEEKIAAKVDLETAQRDLEKGQAALGASESKRQAAITSAAERLRLFGVTEGEVQRLLATRTVNNVLFVKAPRSGVIITKQVTAGQQIDNSNVLFTISDLSTVWLIAQVFEQDVKSMKLGLPVQVTLDSYPDKVFLGTLDYLAPKIDAQTRTLPVRATVSNPQFLLKPQMFAHMRVKTGTCEVLAVPAQAIQRTGETDLAYVPVSPTEFEERRVKVGRTLGSYVEIQSGLRPGETVVVKGSLQLQGEAIQRVGQ